MGDPSKHAKLSPSGSARWFNCPRSIKFSEQVPKPDDSPEAREGSAAHALAELCLTEKTNASENIGRIFDEYPEFTVDEEMAEAVQVYLDEARGKQPSSVEVMIEERFHIGWIHPDIWGTADCCVYNAETSTLHVIDYKHGKGIVIEPEWNSQVMIYAVGALYKTWQRITAENRKLISALDVADKIEIVIAQPRAFHPDGPIRRWTISTADLIFWAINVLKPAAIATESQDAVMRVGSHCRFCPCLAVCPEQVKQALVIAKTDFDNPVLPPPESLTPEDILKVLSLSTVFGNWAKMVKDFARQQMELGMNIQGYKLVQRNAHRKWCNEELVVGAVYDYLGDEVYTTRKLISIAQVEKLLKKAELSPDAILDGLWYKPEIGLAMVEESDRRKAVQASAVTDFTQVEAPAGTVADEMFNNTPSPTKALSFLD